MRAAIVMCLLLAAAAPSAADAFSFPLADGTTWSFLGDSITAQNYHVNYIESYYHLRYPDRQFHFRGAGRGGSTLPEALDRFQPDVMIWGPDVVSLEMGLNGAATKAQFITNLNNVSNETEALGAESVYFSLHPMYRLSGYGASYLERAEAFVEVGTARGLNYADQFNLVWPIWLENLQSPTPVDLQYPVGDEGHPGPSGHLIKTWVILKAMGAPADVSSASFDATGGTMVSSAHCTVSNVAKTATGVSFTRLDDRLPIAVDDDALVGLELRPQIMDEISAYVLEVDGLAAGDYRIIIDGVESAVVSAAELADGYNMSVMTAGPIHDQLLQVRQLIRAKEGWNLPGEMSVYKARTSARYWYGLGYEGQDLIDKVANYITGVAALDVGIRNASQPISRDFEIELVIPPASVVGRYVMYNNSAFDGNNPAANAADDGAIATDKTALLPGGTATFANYTSSSKGVNGIMVDIQNLTGVPTAADFEFKVGNDNNPLGWSAGPTPLEVFVRNGAGTGGSGRVTITWSDNVIEKQWLQVIVLATANTGLNEPDAFYFGNAVGETGNSPTDAEVTPTDEIAVRSNPHTLGVNPAAIDDAYDFNRDRKVGPTDQVICRNNGTSGPTALQLIVLAPNMAPTVNAGSDAGIVLPDWASVDGTVSDDGLPNPPGVVTTTWSQFSGPGTVTFAEANAVDTTATFSDPGVYVLQLEAFDGILSSADTVQIVANSESGTGPFIESGGMVVMEAEHYHDNDTRWGPAKWDEETVYGGYVGDGYMSSADGTVGTIWADCPQISYSINFQTAGTYRIWAHLYADASNNDSVFVGVDDTQIGVSYIAPGGYDAWLWNKYYLDVYISAAVHTFQLRRREPNLCADRMVLTTNLTYTPSGDGPVESPRQE